MLSSSRRDFFKSIGVLAGASVLPAPMAPVTTPLLEELKNFPKGPYGDHIPPLRTTKGIIHFIKEQPDGSPAPSPDWVLEGQWFLDEIFKRTFHYGRHHEPAH